MRESCCSAYICLLYRAAPVDLSDGNRISSHTRTWILISDGVDQQIERPLHCRSVFMPRLVPMCYKHHRICATGLVLHNQRAPNSLESINRDQSSKAYHPNALDHAVSAII